MIKLFRPVAWEANVDWRLTQAFWERPAVYGPMWFKGHMGLDYAWPYPGSSVDIYSATSGRCVIGNEWDKWYGKYIIVDYKDENITYKVLYWHLEEIYVKTGDFLSPMQRIGKMGSTGFSTANHLHFEIKDPTLLENWYKWRIDPSMFITEWPKPEPSDTDFKNNYMKILAQVEQETGIPSLFNNFNGTELENQIKAMVSIGLIRLEEKLTKK